MKYYGWKCISGKLLSHMMSNIACIIHYSKVISENMLPSHLGFSSDKQILACKGICYTLIFTSTETENKINSLRCIVFCLASSCCSRGVEAFHGFSVISASPVQCLGYLVLFHTPKAELSSYAQAPEALLIMLRSCGFLSL